MMQLPQVVLAAVCVLLGVLPALAFRLMQHASDASAGGYGAAAGRRRADGEPALSGLREDIHGPRPRSAPLVLAAVLGLLFLAVYGLSKLGSAPRRAAAPWLCGYAREADCHRYVAHNFYGEIKRYFRWLGGGFPHAPRDKPPAMKELS